MTYAHSSSSMYRTADRVSGVTPSPSSQAAYVAPTVFAGSSRSRGRERVLEVMRGRSRRILRPVGLDSIASRSRYMKYGVAVASPRAAIRSGGSDQLAFLKGQDTIDNIPCR